MQKNYSNIRLLLTPSWLVNFIGLSLAILLTAGVIVLSRYQGSELRQQIFEAQSKTHSSQTASSDSTDSSYNSAGKYISNNKFLSTAPLLLVWAGAGLVVYYFAVSLAKPLEDVVTMHDEMGYIHASRGQMLRESLQHLALRALAVAGWFIFLKVTMSIFLPYALAAAHIAAQSLTVTDAGYGLLAVLVLYADIWLQAIFLRLIVLRPRVFGNL